MKSRLGFAAEPILGCPSVLGRTEWGPREPTVGCDVLLGPGQDRERAEGVLWGLLLCCSVLGRTEREPRGVPVRGLGRPSVLGWTKWGPKDTLFWNFDSVLLSMLPYAALASLEHDVMNLCTYFALFGLRGKSVGSLRA